MRLLWRSLRWTYTAPVDAALEDVAPEDAPVLVPESPDAMADNSSAVIERAPMEVAMRHAVYRTIFLSQSATLLQVGHRDRIRS
jgi:hypothetical protein